MLQKVVERPDDGETVRIGDIAAFLRDHCQVILGCIAAGVLSACLYLVFAKSVYTARAELLIDTRLPQSLREQSGDALISLDTPQVESQVMVLRSEAIMTAVVRNLDLMSDPEFQGGSGWLPSGLWRRSTSTLSEFDRLRVAIATLQKGMDIRRIGLSYAIDISYSSADPYRAARIANEIAEAFIKDQIATRTRAARQGSAWLEARIDELRALMNSSALLVQEFKAKRDYRLQASRDPATAGGKSEANGSRADPPASKVIVEQHTLEELESRASTYRKIYESFLQAYTESVQRQSFPVASARIITLASPPWSKSHPRAFLILLLGTMFGCLAGLSLAGVRQGLLGSHPKSFEADYR